MGIADVVILTAVAVVFALCVRTIYISNRNGCSGCDSRSVCTSRLTGRCRAADDMSYLCTNSYTDCKVAIEIPTGEQYGIVISKENTQLTKDINSALADLKSDGTLDGLETKWFGTTL